MERGDAGLDSFRLWMRIGSLSQSSFSPRELVIETYKHLKESVSTLEGDPTTKR